MKRIFTLAALLLTTIAASAQNGKGIYSKYSEAENVSAVYISPAMFRLIGKIPDLQVEDQNINLAPVIQSLSGLYILDSENPAINASLRSDVEKFIASGRYELLMEAKDDGEIVKMYTIGNEVTVNGFVMLASEESEMTFICIDGKMPRADLENLLADLLKD